MTELSPGPGPRSVDIKRDPILVVQGALTFAVDTPLYLTEQPCAWFAAVPTDVPAGVWPRERYFRLMTECIVGTVDQLVDDYRSKLTNTFHLLTCNGGVIPSLGEASLDKQTRVFERMGVVSGFSTPFFKIDRERYLKWDQRRGDADGFTPRQDAFERDCLLRMVANYSSRRFPADGRGDTYSPPTRDPARIKQLIDALQVMHDDEVARQGRKGP